MSEEVKQELKEVISFVLTLGESLEDAFADKKFELAELALLMPALMKVGPAFTGLEKLKDLKADAALIAEMAQFVKDDLDLDNDKLEEKIENGLEVAGRVYAFVELFKKQEEAQA